MQVLHCSLCTLQVLSSRTHHAPSHNTLCTRPRAPHSILDAIMDTRTFRLVLRQKISACLFHAQQPMAQRLTRESPKPLTFHFWCQSVDSPPANPPPPVTWSASFLRLSYYPYVVAQMHLDWTALH